MLGSLAALALAASTCTPLPGLDAVLSRPDLRFLMFGEAHGTREIPQLFGDAVCAAAAKGGVVVGLEFAPADQRALEAYMRSSGGPAARKTLLASPGWADRSGRQSQALFDLIETLRTMKRGGADLEVVAFDAAPTASGSSAAREEAMARALIDAQAKHGGLAMVLTGLGHADREGWISVKPQFRSAAQGLPASATFSLVFARPGGEHWTCRPPEAGQPPVCQVWSMTVREPVSPRGVRLDAVSRPGFDGIFSTGGQYAASPLGRP